ncbi:hypothetical protein L249_4756 [Ophiocordyceps polyrhachis-furcata BCC 54312]|uniref:Uncharacterized protein n=1 Tax=Ophiocordyceps polyrhachis-furcata BCC 54312 TaxID=1330021 RepID=A0A367L2D1_9HYPO|nr:hypothetical protein L249_4756 [Ophiocordyceps polyrhachis-furcata BCC 54312]
MTTSVSVSVQRGRIGAIALIQTCPFQQFLQGCIGDMSEHALGQPPRAKAYPRLGAGEREEEGHAMRWGHPVKEYQTHPGLGVAGLAGLIGMRRANERSADYRTRKKKSNLLSGSTYFVFTTLFPLSPSLTIVIISALGDSLPLFFSFLSLSPLLLASFPLSTQLNPPSRQVQGSTPRHEGARCQDVVSTPPSPPLFSPSPSSPERAGLLRTRTATGCDNPLFGSLRVQQKKTTFKEYLRKTDDSCGRQRFHLAFPRPHLFSPKFLLTLRLKGGSQAGGRIRQEQQAGCSSTPRGVYAGADLGCPSRADKSIMTAAKIKKEQDKEMNNVSPLSLHPFFPTPSNDMLLYLDLLSGHSLRDRQAAERERGTNHTRLLPPSLRPQCRRKPDRDKSQRVGRLFHQIGQECARSGRLQAFRISSPAVCDAAAQGFGPGLKDAPGQAIAARRLAMPPKIKKKKRRAASREPRTANPGCVLARWLAPVFRFPIGQLLVV